MNTRSLVVVAGLVLLAGLGPWLAGSSRARSGGGAGDVGPRAGGVVAESVEPARIAEETSTETLVPGADPPESPRASAEPTDERTAIVHDAAWRVRLTDADGAPAVGFLLRLEFEGLPAGASERGFPDGFAELMEELERPVSARADPEGVARFESQFLGDSHVSAHLVLVDLVAPDERRVSVDPSPGEEHALALPPTGSLELRAFELDGTPMLDPLEVELTHVAPGEGEDPTLAFERRSWEAALSDGTARWPWVELGHAFEALVGDTSARTRTRSERGGPTHAGETVMLRAERGVDHPILGFRAVDEAGRPLANARLEARRIQWHGGEETSVVVTDASGHFRLDGERSQILESRYALAHGQPGGERRSAYVPHQLTGWTGYRFLGDLVFQPPGVLAAGRVVDEAGAPVAGVQVKLAAQASFEEWSWHPLLSAASTGADGSFELVGEHVREEFEVWAADDGRRAGPRKVAPGTRGVELVLREYRALLGTLLLDDGLEPGVVQLTLEREGEHVAGNEQLATMEAPAADGSGRRERTYSFRTEVVSAGHYDLVAKVAEQEVRRLEDVWVGPDAVPVELDLRGTLRRFTIHLVGASSDPPTGKVAYRAAGSDGDWTREDLAGAPVVLWSRAPALDVRLRVDGHRLVVLDGLVGSTTVTLGGTVRVRLVLETDGPLPAPPYVFDPVVKVDGLRVDSPVGSRWFTDEHREVVFDLAAVGELEVSWHLERRDPNMAMGGDVLRDHRATIHVLDQPGEQRFVLRLPADALRRLVESPHF